MNTVELIAKLKALPPHIRALTIREFKALMKQRRGNLGFISPAKRRGKRKKK